MQNGGNKGGWDKSPSLSIIFGLSSKTQWLSGLSTLISSAFTALLNCAEVGRRNRILTND
ncbi:Peptide deformylase [Streptococcus sp. HSISM1]|nr:Peptide deformylase [Streptococcus sp. HSISM1]